MKQRLARYWGRTRTAWRWVASRVSLALSKARAIRLSPLVSDGLSLAFLASAFAVGSALVGLAVAWAALVLVSATAAFVVCVIVASGVLSIFLIGSIAGCVILVMRQVREWSKPPEIDAQAMFERLLKPPHQQTYADQEQPDDPHGGTPPIDENMFYTRNL